MNTTMPLDTAELKTLVTVESYFLAHGCTQDADGRWRCLRWACHTNGDAHASVTISNGRAKCWSQNCFGDKGADIFAVVGVVEHLSDFKSQKRRVQELAGVRVDSPHAPRQILRRFLYRDGHHREAWKIRWDTYESGKKCTWAHDPDGLVSGKGDCQPTLYMLERVNAVARAITCEGERDADTVNHWLGELGITDMIATTTAHGAGDVKADYLAPLFGKAMVYLSGDNDKAGRNYLAQCTKGLRGQVPDLRILSVPEGAKDWTDWHERGATAHDFLRLLNDAPLWTPEEVTSMLQPMNDSVSGLSGPHIEEWPEILPIKTELLQVETLPLAIIPTPFRAWIKDVSDRMQCPPDFVASAMLVMTSSVIGAGCGIRPKKKDDWLVIPNLWGGVVGRPSTMKTPAIGEAMKPLDDLSATAKREYDEKIKAHLAEVEVFKAHREKIVCDMKQAARGKADVPSMDCLKDTLANLKGPEPTVWRRYVTNDATIEKMAELQATNPRGLLLFRDELVGLFATWDKDGHEADRTFYMEGWNGDRSHTSDRIGRGTTHVPNLCVSLFGGIQPAKLTSYLYAAMRGLNNDGLVQRLQVLVYPDELKTWTLVDRPIDAPARQAAFQTVKRLATMDVRQVGAYAEEGQTPYFRFDDAAQAIFNEWLTDLEAKLRTDEEPVIQEHLGKYRSLMPSLALIFHLLNLAHAKGVTTGSVTAECAMQAAAWCDYLETHARRIYGLVTNVTAQAATRLAVKLQQGLLPQTFTARDVYRKEWSLLNDRQIIENACDELVSLRWLRERLTPPTFGQRGKTEYVTNPKAKVME